MNILRQPKAKKPKKSAIENYKISYIDKRSKKYHKIIMTGFIAMFGFVGGTYLFSSSAASTDAAMDTNRNPLPYLVFIITLFIIMAAVVGMKRKK